MTERTSVGSARDKLLFTPGPLTTSAAVKAAMLHDAGSWHFEFNDVVKRIRERLLDVAGVSRSAGWDVVLLQGSGTFGVEAVFQTCVPPDGKVLVLVNGAYGERMAQMLGQARIPHEVLRRGDDIPVDPTSVDAALARDPDVTHIAMVHCETTTGILNPIAEIGQVVCERNKSFIVDAMSSFGGIPIDLEECAVDYLVSSSNKCIEGVPGFSFVVCRRDALLACDGFARSLSLDLVAQLRGFEKNGQFRFTPPTHVLLAFDQALAELEAEGGVRGRHARYRANHAALIAGMSRLGFEPFLRPEVQSCIITAFLFPPDDTFEFTRFYRGLSDRGFIIYPGKLTQVNTFRIGNIGRLFSSDIEQLVLAVGAVCREMGILPEFDDLHSCNV